MSQAERKAKHLKDYKQPVYAIHEVSLEFDLFEDHARVKSCLKVRRRDTTTSVMPPLVLNGEHLQLLRVSMNGKELSASEYSVTSLTLTISDPPRDFTLEIENKIEPQKNQALEGLYKSGDIFCTQNEPEGFRRITYYLDRPDVMAKFTTRISADKSKYPVLLSNGNPSESGDLDGGRHFVTWQDPFPKPSYLFALVAGDLGLVEDEFAAKSGRKIQIRMYVDKGNESKCAHAMDSLKRAMKWDEDTFGLECDLDTYMIVGVDAFNMGAMENKGLNIFNSQYILADPKTATDGNYEAIEGVIGHEYFHNWTGNRVTCRDWFQITLKEGLTIFRDQEFSADMSSRSVRRISNVRVLRDYQFVEDAGPNAHPIRPQSYLEINNFYTVTVYEKGAEVIRMIHTLIGNEAFRRGMDTYFKLFDGQAVTTDDFVHAMEQASGVDLTQFKLWYEQAGTPICRVKMVHDAAKKTVDLTVEQQPPTVSKGKATTPFYFPLSVGLLNRSGKDLFPTRILPISKEKETFSFDGVDARPVPSLLRNASAPVYLQYDYTPEELMFLFATDSDDFNRFDAGQQLVTICLNQLIVSYQQRVSTKLPPVDQGILDAFGKLIKNKLLDPAFRAECWVLPTITRLTEPMDTCDFDAAFASREHVIRSLAGAHERVLHDIYKQFHSNGAYSINAESVAKRTLKNLALHYLMVLERPEFVSLAWSQFENATNMTDEIAALAALNDHDVPERARAVKAFHDRWRDNSLVMNKWFAVQASSKRRDVLDVVKGLEKSPVYDAKNPNKIRSLIGVFSGNLVRFHAASGAGYAYVADKILEIDRFNPMVAARLAGCFKKYAKLDSKRKVTMSKELERIIAVKELSKDVYEIVSKTLGKVEAEAQA
jgi:aminopeptidase N